MEGPAKIQPAGKSKKKVSPARNVVGVVLLIAFATFAGVEWNANHRATLGAAKLDEKMADEQAEMLSIDEVNSILGKQPDAGIVRVGREQKMTYTWKGFVRKHGIVAYYNLNKLPKLNRIEGF